MPTTRASLPPDSAEWSTVVFQMDAGKIAAVQTDRPAAVALRDAQTAAADACSGRIPAAPAPFNRGGLIPIETRLTLIMSVMLLAIVATVLLSVVLHLVRRLRTPA